MVNSHKTRPQPHVLSEVQGRVGLITLNRSKALNALSLAMVRDITAALLAWRDDDTVLAVAFRGMGKDKTTGEAAPFGAFCAGGDIRYFHQAALAGDPTLEDFFTEEYTLNHLIHTYPKPTMAFMDGIVMGGGMGIAQGCNLRVVTERTKMAMPETNIGLFPDVGGGYFLSRCPGHVGEYLALTGEIIGGRQAVAWGLADGYVESQQLNRMWHTLAETPFESGAAAERWITTEFIADNERRTGEKTKIDAIFGLSSVAAMLSALEGAAEPSDWTRATAKALRHRSPLMLHVVLEQVRRARHLGLADDLRMERSLVRHCFHLRPGTASETVEGIRALAVDKDHKPLWNPSTAELVTPEMVQAFFEPAWPAHANPLRHLN